MAAAPTPRFNLAQVDGLGRVLGPGGRPRCRRDRPDPSVASGVQNAPTGLLAAAEAIASARRGGRRFGSDWPPFRRLIAAIEAAQGGKVYIRDLTAHEHQRARLICMARRLGTLEMGTGYPEGKAFGRPPVWVRKRGGN